MDFRSCIGRAELKWDSPDFGRLRGGTGLGWSGFPRCLCVDFRSWKNMFRPAPESLEDHLAGGDLLYPCAQSIQAEARRMCKS